MLSEPAIQVRRRCRGKQIWSLEKMENRLVDMRELYQEWQEYHVHHQDDPVCPTPPLATKCKMSSFSYVFSFLLQVMRSYFRRADPFFDEQENHSLIGVANVFLSCLFYDVKLQYAVPIINQKGEVGGHRLANFFFSAFCFYFFLLLLNIPCSYVESLLHIPSLSSNLCACV